MKVVIIIPAYNEARVISSVLLKLRKARVNKTTIIVVDDGSNDTSGEIARKMGVLVVRHKLNLGLGAALATGLLAAKRIGAEAVVTFDADGQHKVEDLQAVLEPVTSGKADVVIGTRLRHSASMPVSRFFLNWLANVLTFFLFGVWTTDSQSGLRAFSKRALNSIILRTHRMEVSSEIFGEIKKHKLAFVEVPITPIYTSYSLTKGQKAGNSLQVIWKLFLRRLR